MKELTSSIPGLSKFPGRDDKISTSEGYIESKRKIDGAEGLWRINNQLYDLTGFDKKHPGGSEWIKITKGTDITELFESHHITDKPQKLLPKFYIRDATTPRSAPFTFNENGFYKKFKKRAIEALKNVDFHKPTLKSNLISDLLLIITIIFSLIAVTKKSYFSLIISGISMALTVITGHNYFHMRDNFRMYYFDISGMSSRDWRITHAMSHHMYPNTIWDYEIYTFEGIFQWLPSIKSYNLRKISWIYAPLIWTITFYAQIIIRYIKIFLEKKNFEFRDFVPFFLPILMYFISGNLCESLKLWILIVGIGSFVFGTIGVNAAHHHPDIFHDGDVPRKDLDWGLLEMDAVRDRKIVDDSHFFILTQFGQHTLHHLLPTVDHGYLDLCLPALEETCKEFGINFSRLTPLELMKGQFQQLRRIYPKKNHR